MKQDGRKVQGALQILTNKQTYDLTGKEKYLNYVTERNTVTVFTSPQIFENHFRKLDMILT